MPTEAMRTKNIIARTALNAKTTVLGEGVGGQGSDNVTPG